MLWTLVVSSASSRVSGGENSQRNRQVKTRSLFLDIRWSQIDGEVANWKLKTRIRQRRDNPIFRFLDRGVRESDDHDLKIPPAAIYLDLDGESLNAIDRGGTNPGKHRPLYITTGVSEKYFILSCGPAKN